MTDIMPDRFDKVTLDWLVQCGGELVNHQSTFLTDENGELVVTPRVHFTLHEDTFEPLDDSYPWTDAKEVLVIFPPPEHGVECEVEIHEHLLNRKTGKKANKGIALLGAKVRNRGEVRALLEALGGEAMV